MSNATPRLSLRDEILEALARNPEGTSGYKISRTIEQKWEAEGRRSRFLFWTFSPVIGFGTLYRALDELVRVGWLSRSVDRTREPPRVTYRLRDY